jgi:hypothetical protein
MKAYRMILMALLCQGMLNASNLLNIDPQKEDSNLQQERTRDLQFLEDQNLQQEQTNDLQFREDQNFQQERELGR